MPREKSSTKPRAMRNGEPTTGCHAQSAPGSGVQAGATSIRVDVDVLRANLRMEDVVAHVNNCTAVDLLMHSHVHSGSAVNWVQQPTNEIQVLVPTEMHRLTVDFLIIVVGRIERVVVREANVRVGGKAVGVVIIRQGLAIQQA